MNAAKNTGEYSEDSLVEQPAIELFAELGWQTANLYNETFGEIGTEGRESEHEVILAPRLRKALERLNPDLPAEAIENAATEILRDRSLLTPVNANRELYKLVRDGVKVRYRDSDGYQVEDSVRVVDWREPENNDFFLASQL